MGYIEKSFGQGNLWTLGMGLGFILWGILYYTVDRVHTGGWWCFIPGGVLFLSGISNIMRYRYNRERILGALKSYKRVSLSHLADEIKLPEKSVKDMIIDLRTEGKLKASFDPESGDIIVFEVKGIQPPVGAQFISSVEVSEPIKSMPSPKALKEEGYCPYCGSMVNEKDQFCNNCGSAL
ncbi:MAG TPA: zinc-ribbon domain-containing protein [Candidatus Bathyarchaeia archaeon]|nr:zinc-ribbon domain-containing protein [Candidatus Bathyarchaeia archaeon]